MGRKEPYIMDDFDNIKWIKITPESVDLYNVDGTFKRLPDSVSDKINDIGKAASKYSAGGRARFSTDSNIIVIHAKMSLHWDMGFDLYRVDEKTGREYFAAGYRDTLYAVHEGEFYARLGEGMVQNERKKQFYTLNFPCFAFVEYVEIGIEKEANFGKGLKYKNEKPVVFYGSSITNGGLASRPGMTYTSLISQKYALDYINLGLSGGAKGDRALVEYMACLEMSCFVCDYDHNAYEDGLLEATHLPMYKTIRQKHPDIPYIIISKPDCFKGYEDSRRRFAVIEKTYEYAKSEGDKNVYLIDGSTLFEGEYYTACTFDGCHPNDVGFMRMAEKIGNVIAEAMGLCTDKHDIFLK